MKPSKSSKRSFRESRWYRPLLLAATFLSLVPTGVVVFAFPVSNHLVHGDWVEFRKHWESRGEIFDLDLLLPPAIPDEENFAKSPIITETYRKAAAPRMHSTHDHEAHEHHEEQEIVPLTRLGSFSVFSDPTQARQPFPKRPLAYVSGIPISLKHYLPENHSAESTDEVRNYFTDLFVPHEPVISELMAAAALPGAHYAIDRARPSATQLSHLPEFITALHSLHLHNLTLVNSDQTDRVCEQTAGTLRLIRHGTETPGLVAYSIRISALEQGPLEVIWQALFRQRLNSGQWMLIQEELKPFRFGDHLLNSLRFERAAVIREVENQFEKNRTRPFSVPPAWAPISGLLQYGELTQRFWFTDAANGAPLKDRPRGIQLSMIESFVAEKEPSFSNLVLAAGVLPAAELALRAERVEIQRDHARIAIALECYRLEHGSLPDRLSQLVPQWLSSIPLHPTTDLPPRYERPTPSPQKERPDEYRLRAVGEPAEGGDPIWVMPHRVR